MFIKNKLALIESLETMVAQEQRMNQISNNLANVDSAGYKRESNTFHEVLIKHMDRPPRVGKGVKVITDHSQGTLEPTANPLDVAISGEGFFRVQTPDGVRYTRAGNFQLNREGQLATSNGHLVLGESGTIVIEGERVTVTSTGAVIVDDAEVARLQVVRFADPALLEKEGLNLFRPVGDEGGEEAATDFTVQQGYLEGANVNTIVEMTAMMDLYRDYESQQRVIRVVDEMNSDTVSRVGRLA
ncbi:MAG: flagellar basal-body rod protein FlgF [Proteobacteria bacterium]|nr:flagellar basal-body rod protein FlgF [Pseudomonadota bacterium]MBU1737198.1 flagellar basal-body rod protein FlgF [Pseudomonadota bacterium]